MEKGCLDKYTRTPNEKLMFAEELRIARAAMDAQKIDWIKCPACKEWTAGRGGIIAHHMDKPGPTLVCYVSGWSAHTRYFERHSIAHAIAEKVDEYVKSWE